MTDSASKTEAEGAGAEVALAVPVWDLPIRLVHWSLVLLIGFSWWSAENGRIEWHIRSGLAVLFLLLFRILWGFFGSSTARFATFLAGPKRLIRYLSDPGGWRGVGHSPLGAVSVVALLGLMTVQVLLGLPLSDEDGVVTGPLNRLVSFETAELAHDLHESLFTVLQWLIALHIAAILFYRWRGNRLTRTMVTGSSIELPPGTAGMVTEPPARLALALFLAAAISGWIASGAPGL